MIQFLEKKWRVIPPELCSVFDLKNKNKIEDLFFKQKVKAIYLINNDGSLKGILSKGDFLRNRKDFSWNFSPFYLKINKDLHPKNKLTANKFNSIPILDEENKLIKVIEITDKEEFYLNGIDYKKYENPLIIAEIGNNHNGSLERGFELIDLAAQAGVNTVKFQARSLKDLYVDLSDEYLNLTDFSTSYTVNQLKKFNLPQESLSKLFDHAKTKGLLVACTPFDVESAKFLKKSNIDFIKIASADMSNYDLLSQFSDTSLPLLISTGMHSENSIKKLGKWLHNSFIDATLLHVNSTYPTPYSDVNLRYMPKLSKFSTSSLFGYSGHERGTHIPIAAIALGASVIEKHFTLDKKLEGNDHKVSLTFDELKDLVKNVSTLCESLSRNSNDKIISQGEKLNKIALSKGVYAKRFIKAGEVLTKEDISFLSPCVGITPEDIDNYLGKIISKSVLAKEPIEKSSFEHQNFNINLESIKNYGLPVRFRDIEKISNIFNPSFYEYHMFSTDLELDPNDFSKLIENKKFTIHAPEQFGDGFILDLVSENSDTLKKSNQIFEEIINWVLKFKYLTKQNSIKLIVNVGGATNDRDEVYKFNKESAFEKLSVINTKCIKNGIKFLPQTMPPFPWHYGGQGFHRLFVDPQDMAEIQNYSPMEFCMDISHSFMSCSHLGIDFYEMLNKFKHLFSYFHIADAIYPGEEGINIGVGQIDFSKIRHITNSDAFFWIPEVWNGHLNNFQGFKDALNKLNKI